MIGDYIEDRVMISVRYPWHLLAQDLTLFYVGEAHGMTFHNEQVYTYKEVMEMLTPELIKEKIIKFVRSDYSSRKSSKKMWSNRAILEKYCKGLKGTVEVDIDEN
jgi:hypothetical protein